MKFRAAQLPSGRWGIFTGDRLLATIGSQQTVNIILACLPGAQVPVSATNQENASA
ncbi:MAG: hypothetical protein AAFQ74_17655 [Cyanobacteria bacterium J06623_4]